MERILFPIASCVNLKQFTNGRLPDVIAAQCCGVGKWLCDQYALHRRARSSRTITVLCVLDFTRAQCGRDLPSWLDRGLHRRLQRGLSQSYHLRESVHSDRECYLFESLATELGDKFLCRFAQLFPALPSGIQRRIGQNNDELFAAITLNDVFSTPLR
jgi:hypothetical protein